MEREAPQTEVVVACPAESNIGQMNQTPMPVAHKEGIHLLAKVLILLPGIFKTIQSASYVKCKTSQIEKLCRSMQTAKHKVLQTKN